MTLGTAITQPSPDSLKVTAHEQYNTPDHLTPTTVLPDPLAPGRLRAAAYDPTHGAAPGLNYITVAVGRDYADVAPTSGAFTGGATGRLAPHKDAWIVGLDEGAA